MLSLSLTLLLAATPPSSQAAELAGKKDWAELYLAFVSTKPDTYPAEARQDIAKALLAGCSALLRTDPVLASSLAETSVRFQPSAEASLCQAQGAKRSNQLGFALSTLQDAHDLYPDDPGITLALGEALLHDREHRLALDILSGIPPSAPEHRRARPSIQKARAALAKAEAELAQAKAEARQEREGTPSDRNTVKARGSSSGRSQRTRSAEIDDGMIAGMHNRAHRNYSIRYFANGRDFGERATYQTRVINALDESAAFTRRVLGFACEKPIDVILYSREEFAAHMGRAAATRVAGLYYMSAIRLNNAAELTKQTHATLTHEYVHAVVDELAGGNARAVPIWFNEGLAEYVEWRFLGSRNPPHGTRVRLRGAALDGSIPSLESLSSGALIGTRDPALSYAVSALAVRHLLDKGSSLALRKLIIDVAGGTSFPDGLRRHFHISVAQLDRAVQSAAGSR